LENVLRVAAGWVEPLLMPHRLDQAARGAAPAMAGATFPPLVKVVASAMAGAARPYLPMVD
jgi:hypothetical protein